MYDGGRNPYQLTSKRNVSFEKIPEISVLLLAVFPMNCSTVLTLVALDSLDR